jgi:hypothetical protein
MYAYRLAAKFTLRSEDRVTLCRSSDDMSDLLSPPATNCPPSDLSSKSGARLQFRLSSFRLGAMLWYVNREDVVRAT